MRISSGVPGRGFQKVQRHFGRLQRLELGQQFNPLLIRFAHPQQSATAQLHVVLLDQFARLVERLPRVSRDDRPEERLSGLEVVVVAMHAGLGQSSRLIVGEDARAHRNVHAGLGLDQRDEFDDALHRAFVGALYGQDDAELGCASSGGLPGCGQHLVGVEERRGWHRVVELG